MKNIFKFSFPLFFIPLLIPSSAGINSPDANPPRFPVPPKTENFLFYLQRTININTIVYELNLDEKNEISLEEPIKIKWIQYAKDSTIEPLNYIQRKFAYGLVSKLIDPVNKSFEFHFVSYNGKPLYLIKSAIDNKYHVYISINNKLSVLDRIFVQIDGGTFWVPEISYVEVSGTAPVTAEKMIEKIKP